MSSKLEALRQAAGKQDSSKFAVAKPFLAKDGTSVVAWVNLQGFPKGMTPGKLLAILENQDEVIDACLESISLADDPSYKASLMPKTYTMPDKHDQAPASKLAQLQALRAKAGN